jgi:hypothetical protein
VSGQSPDKSWPNFSGFFHRLGEKNQEPRQRVSVFCEAKNGHQSLRKGVEKPHFALAKMGFSTLLEKPATKVRKN